MPRLRTLPILGLVATALLLAGCSAPAAIESGAPPVATPLTTSSASAAVAPTATSSAAPTPTGSASAAEQRYLGFTKSSTPSLAALDDATLLALGNEVCGGFAAGDDTTAISTRLDEDPRATGLDAPGAVFVIGAAVGTLCPKYHDALQSDG